MPVIVLLCSIHKKNGKCNPSELSQILQHVKPDVLFQEIPYFEFLEKDYSRSQSILEILAIKDYLKRHEVLQKPVDTLGGSSLEPERFGEVINRVSRTSQEFRDLWDHINCLEYTRGFEYLNSRSHDFDLRRQAEIVVKELRRLNEERLSMAYDQWNIYNSRRDEAMIRNVYEFCRVTKFNKGVFLFGSGHRQSLIHKIRMLKKTEAPQVHWKLDCGMGKSG
jgi:hypothetical protein